MTPLNESERHTDDFKPMIKIAILNSLGFFFLGFLVPVIAKENMDASAFIIGLIISSLVFGHIISSSFVGFLTDRTKSKSRLVFLGSIGRGISYFMIYFAIIGNSLIGLWIGEFILGFGAGFFWIPFDTIVSEKSNKDHRSYAFGKRDSANAIGQMLGGLFGFFILLVSSFFTDDPAILYSAIILFGIANFIGAFLFLRNVDESIKFETSDSISNSKNNTNKVQSLKEKMPTQKMVGLIVLFIVILLSSINANIWRPFINIYIIENVSENVIVAMLIYLPAGIMATLLAPKLGAIMDRVNPTVGIIVTSLIGAFVTWLLINISIIPIFAIIVLIDITIAMAAGLLFRNIISRIYIEHRGKIMGINTFFASIGAIVGPILGGLLWDALGSTTPFIISIFVELMLIPLYLIVVRLLIHHMAESYDKLKEKKN